MRNMLVALLFGLWLMPIKALAATDGVACSLEPASIVSRSASGIEQVSNVGDIQVRCSVPARPVSLKPGESLFPLGAKTASASMRLPDGTTKEVAVEVIGAGGGSKHDRAWVEVYLHLPLDPAQRDAEARRAMARLDDQTAKNNSRVQGRVTEEERQRRVSSVAQIVFQHRAGRFRVECYLTQGDRSVGTGEVRFEVLPKGRFSDLWPFPVGAQ